MKRPWVLVGLATFAAACSDGPTDVPGAPLASHSATGVQGHARYIVRFRDSERDEVGQTDRLVRAHRGRLAYRYRTAIKGFAGEFSAQDIAALMRDRDVVSVEEDQLMYAIATQLNPPSWGLDRIDQSALPLSSSYTYATTSAGVTVYIIDTGILLTHNDFGGRAVTGVDQITPGGTAADCNGHGTHVAGTVGGSSYGVAKGVTLVAVRVLGCTGSGSTAGVIAGVDWVTARKLANPSVPSVANMSLGGGFSSALNAAVTNSINAGVTYAVAAGNSNANACNSSPSSTPNALTVGSTTITDARSSFSNFGSCLDIFAPGSSITSAWIGSNSATNTISGTSMASPHVAGAAALYLGFNPSATPAAVGTALINNATMNVVTNPGTGSPNRLLYTGFITGTPIPPPVASFTWSCPTLTCTFDASSTVAQPNASYTWLWGDGSRPFGTGKIATHTYAQPWGNVTMRLVVIDAGGSSISTQTIQVPQPPPPTAPVASFTFSCTALSCTFDGSASVAQPNATYSWSWGDGTPDGSGVTAAHTYASAGTRSVTLAVTDAGGTGTNIQQVTVTVPPPVADFTWSCQGLTCTFDASSTVAQPNATYEWHWGDGTRPFGSGVIATHTYAYPWGNVTMSLTVYDAGGNSTAVKTIVVQ